MSERIRSTCRRRGVGYSKHCSCSPTSIVIPEPCCCLTSLTPTWRYCGRRQTYNLLIQVAEQQGSQIIAASHSEVVLNEAAERDTVIAFVGKPHRIDDRGSQALKALRDIGFEQYYEAEETGWVLYLENATDLSILQAFARSLDHEAQRFLARPFVKYVETNLPQRAHDHFHGLREAKNDLVGIAIFDRLDGDLQSARGLTEIDVASARKSKTIFAWRAFSSLMPDTTYPMIFLG